MNNHKDFMKEAIRLAESNVDSGTGGPFAAVIVKDGEIIARGTNKVTTNNDPSAHAEISAIRKACKILKNYSLEGCEIYTSCEPCPMCLGAIYWARLEKVYFGLNKTEAKAAGFDDAHIYDEIKMDFVDRKIPFIQIRNNEALQPFQKWNKSKNKISY